MICRWWRVGQQQLRNRFQLMINKLLDIKQKYEYSIMPRNFLYKMVYLSYFFE